MKSFQIKFPRRVRIHGGECGAVARALHHEAHEGALTQFEQSLISDEKAFMRQAELEKASSSTSIERKQMSTKTSIKRIALVAVSALGFGLLSVMPANAAQTLIADSDITMTGTGSSNAYVLSGAASITNTATVNTATPVAFGWKVTDPSGNSYYIGTDFANATVGTVSAVASKASTLTFATGFLAEAGKWTVTVASEDADATELNTQAEIVTAVGTANKFVAEDFFVYSTSPTFSPGLGRTVTSGIRVAQDVNGVATLFVVSDDTSASYTVTSSGVGAIQSAFANNTGKTLTVLTGNTGDTVVNNNGTNPAGGVTWTPNVPRKSYIQIRTSSSVAGTQTITVVPLNSSGTPGVPATANITWGSAVEISAASTAYMAAVDASTFSAATNAVARSAARAAGTSIADIKVSIVGTDGAADARANTLLASVTGPGFIDVETTQAATANASVRRILNTDASATRYVRIYSDGTSGTGTVSLTLLDASSDKAISLGTFTYNSTGSAASIAVSTSRYKIGRAGYTTGGASSALSVTNWVTATATTPITPISAGVTTPAFVVQVKDASGNLVTPSSTPVVLSSDLTVSSGGTCALDNGSDATYSSSTNGIGVYNCNFSIVEGAASGAKATLTIRIPDPASTTGGFLTTTYDVTVGGAAGSTGGTETLALDKTSYQPGEGMTITRTCKDASGNPCYDGQIAGAVSFSKANGGTAPTAAFYIGGTVSSNNSLGAQTVFAPVTGGKFEARMTGRVAGVSSTIIAPSQVSDDAATAAANAASDAAAEAIDAANAATDAANLAAEAADAATVAAEEARDAADAATAAVEKLASDVATLMAALKAQITTLANTVAKIAKKVKA